MNQRTHPGSTYDHKDRYPQFESAAARERATGVGGQSWHYPHDFGRTITPNTIIIITYKTGREKKKGSFHIIPPTTHMQDSAIAGYGVYHPWRQETQPRCSPSAKRSGTATITPYLPNNLGRDFPDGMGFGGVRCRRYTAQLRLGSISPRATEPVTNDTTCHLLPLPARRSQKLRDLSEVPRPLKATIQPRSASATCTHGATCAAL